MRKALEVTPRATRVLDLVSGRVVFLLVAALIFGIAHALAPIYASNQNAHLLRGLADGGLGLLNDDWFANTKDPFPIFTFGVAVTYRFLHEYFFYVYHVLLAGVYFYSIVGIAATIFKIDSSWPKYISFVAILTLIHTGVFGFVSNKILGVNLAAELQNGVAQQFVLGFYFQPSVFGVFILLSIYFFLIKRPFVAVLLLGVAAWTQSIYLLSMGAITLSYMYVLFREGKSIKKPFLIGTASAILIVPVLAYVYIFFRQTSPEVWSESVALFVNFRAPHHTDWSVWLDAMAYAKTAVVIVALFLVRRTPLFPILLVPLAIAVVLTAVQIISDSNSLAAATPWRLSVFLVPIATGVIVAYAVSGLWKILQHHIYRYEKAVIALGLAAIGLLLVAGIVSTRNNIEDNRRSDSVPMMNFVRETKMPGDQYLIPLSLDRFRIFTGAPILVDLKAFPFKDVESLEWRDRYQAAGQFYDSGEDATCGSIDRLAEEYRITHVVSGRGRFDTSCSNLAQIYGDDNYRVFRIEP